MSLIKTDEDKLRQEGFTESGVKRYVNTITEYSDLLFERSKKFGEVRKATDSSVEINYENVQRAARIISESFGSEETPQWKLWVQAGEYLLTAACGYLGSQATTENAKPIYTLLFVIAAVLGVGLFIVRRTSKN